MRVTGTSFFDSRRSRCASCISQMVPESDGPVHIGIKQADFHTAIGMARAASSRLCRLADAHPLALATTQDAGNARNGGIPDT